MEVECLKAQARDPAPNEVSRPIDVSQDGARAPIREQSSIASKILDASRRRHKTLLPTYTHTFLSSRRWRPRTNL
jgi:hypothetical protein